MKKMTRLGVILSVIGISLLLVTVFRASSPHTAATGLEGSKDWWMFNPELWAPRNLILEVSSDSKVDIYILDEYGIKSWEEDETLNPLFAFNEVEHDRYTVQLKRRGKHAFLIHNPSNLDVTTKLTLTFYGFENDLLMASIALTVSGSIIIVAGATLTHVKPNKHDDSYKRF